MGEEGSEVDASPPSSPKRWRAGLGLPPIVHIRSTPPPTRRALELAQDARDALLDQIPNDPKEWRDWNVNPAKHGPPKSVLPPVFVRGQGAYDELGRSAIEGVDVEIDRGRVAREEREGGEGVAAWYRTLSRSNTRPPSPKMPVGSDRRDVLPNESMAGPSRTRTSRSEPIDLTESPPSSPPAAQQIRDDTSDPAIRPRALATSTTSSTSQSKPLRVHSKEWFIRRALLRQSQSNPSTPPPDRDIPPSSISSLLNIQTQPRLHTPRYVLGPDNKGYELLRDQGWGGGGLGRPTGWTGDSARLSPPDAIPDVPTEPSENDLNDYGVVDLTQSDDDEDVLDEDVVPDGPGRTAPISTSLKLDRLGLGHQRAQRIKTQVSHSAKDIRDAQRRAKYSTKRMGIELGKAGKIKWKDKEKREREERRRIAAALNS